MKMYKFEITGIVQGVGFRPFIYNECKKENLIGYVLNTGIGVTIVTNNKEKVLEILKNIPPLARIDSINITKTKEEHSDFKIIKSSGNGFSEIPADVSICNDCLNELKNGENKRYNYFFITCTNCGPRFSMTNKTPYDRPNTAMNEFNMCKECSKEYTDFSNRRFHAQTIACEKCGPKINLFENGRIIGKIKETANLIKKGEIISIKGNGGFHLACNINENTIKQLRDLKKRNNKPFALMAKNIETIEKYCNINEIEKKELLSLAKPIVLLEKKENIQNEISELDSLGFMLPYTPLHYLLLNYLDEPIILTSSNKNNEPISFEKEKQFTKYILDYNRKILNPLDDSVVKIVNNERLLIRRSRGFTPNSILLKNFKKENNILSLGAELNNTFSVLKNGRVIMSQYNGNIQDFETFERMKENLEKFMNLTNLKPETILCDMNPNYNSTIFAKELSEKSNISIKKVQHHLAHIYSVAAENNLDNFVGISCDGTGYGLDGNIWGGEVFYNDKRIGNLEEQTLIGNESAILNPKKMLVSILSNFLDIKEMSKLSNLNENEIQILLNQKEENFNCVKTTSCGRILDSASALLGFCDKRTYEARPALLLESNSTEPFEIKTEIKNNILLTTPLFEFLVNNFNEDKKRLGATVQNYLAKGLYEIASQFNEPIVFSGGCAYNKIMNSFLTKNNVLVNRFVPCGDSGISLGQIYYHLKTKY